jgi:hypothetical protein
MKRPDAKILEDIRDIECQLSPENLFCDGERPASEARKIERQLLRKKAELIKELGREPGFNEIYG